MGRKFTRSKPEFDITKTATEQQLKKKRHYKLWMLGAMGVCIILATSAYGVKSFFDKYYLISPIQTKDTVMTKKAIEKSDPSVSPSPSPTPAEQSNKGQQGLVKTAYASSKVIQGKVSYYSHAGCLGCGVQQITASGEPFNENAMTLAVVPGSLPMKTMVRVTNLDNGKSIIAKVNDTGGFAKYNRIADLSLGLYNYLGAKTDVSTIRLEVL